MTTDEIEYVRENRDFIKAHLHQDPFKLALKFSSDPEKKILITQIQARQKIRKKLPAWYANEDLILPPGLSLEQASSEATARLKASLISGSHLLDITGGLGVDCHYLSKNFKSATYVEQNEELYQLADYNFRQLKAPITTLFGDGVEILNTSDADVVYIDPYRRDDSRNKVVALSDCQPDVTAFLDQLTAEGRNSLIKASPMLDISLAIDQLKKVMEVWVISNRNECKEVLFLLGPNPDTIKVKTFDIYPHATSAFEFELKEAHNLQPKTGSLNTYLYEPNASIMKSGGQDYLGRSFGLFKLHHNSNLFTSSELLKDFPGKVFRVINETRPFDKSLKGKRFNVISRNFPSKGNEIEKKLKLKSSDKDYLIATKFEDGHYGFIVGELLATS